MSDALPIQGQDALGRAQRGERRVFSPRLEAFLNRIHEGETPNAGDFCSFCYNPLPAGLERCDACGQSLRERPPTHSLPDDVIVMHARKLKRESVVVNSFAYLGLALGVTIFLGMVAINVLYMEKALWFFILATVVLFVACWVLPNIIGGFIGDEIGYRYANKRLSEDWTNHLTNRQEQDNKS